jgi:hypothetical protein
VFTLSSGADVTPPTQPAPNQELAVHCGLKVLLVLDESTSILNENAVDDVRNGADAFVTALKDTGSQVAITAFGNTARDGVVPYQEVTSSTVSTFTDWIHNKVPGGYNVTTNTGTNWEDALLHVPEVSGGPPDLVVFVTDGDPTIYNTSIGAGTAGIGSPLDLIGLDRAVTAANAVKRLTTEHGHTHMFVVGVGPAVTTPDSPSVQRMQEISGPNQFPQHSDFATADYTLVTDFGALEKSLGDIVGQLCGGTLTITKYESVPNGTGWTEPEAHDGWEFTATLAGDHTWTVPDVGSGNPAKLKTGDDGKAVFEFGFTSEEGKLTLVRENSKPNFRFDYSTCTVRDPSGETTDVQERTNGPILENQTVPRHGFVTCVVYNKRKSANLTVVKRVLPSGDPGRFNLLVDGISRKDDVTDGGATPKLLLALGKHKVSEQAAAGTNLADYSISTTCVDESNHSEVVVPPTASTPGSDGVSTPVLVKLKSEADDIVCTITNTSTTHGNLTVIKHVPDDSTGHFNLVITHAGTQVARADDVTDGGSTGRTFLPFGTYVVSEEAAAGTNLADYTSTITCIDEATGATIVHGPGPSLSVTLDRADLQCTITNARKPPSTLPRLRVNLRVRPSDDPGLFDLLIGDEPFAEGVGDHGTTGSLVFQLGGHKVGLRAVAGTNLADYTISTTCVDETTHHVVASGTGSTPVGVDLKSAADNVVCTITLTRKRPAGGGGTVPPPPCDDIDQGVPECGSVATAPQLLVTKRMRAHARVGDRLPTTITVHNAGRGTADQVRLHETPSHGGRIVVVAEHGSIGHRHRNAVWNLGNLAPGATRTVHATVLVTRAGLLVNAVFAVPANANPSVAQAAVRVRAVRRHRRPPPPPPRVTG